MPLFNCTNCSVIENTALCRYWPLLYTRDKSIPFNPLCSKCDPEIGEWHGRFDRRYLPVNAESLAPGAPKLLNAERKEGE